MTFRIQNVLFSNPDPKHDPDNVYDDDEVEEEEDLDDIRFF